MTAAVADLRGSETPRIWTKPLRPLTPETSHGFAAIAFAEQVLGLTLFPWQKWLLIHALELLPDGTYRFRTVVVLVARQNGKTLVMLVLALWHIYALESRTVIGTAQDLANAEKAWEEAVEMAQGEPELEELIEDIKLGHPKRFLVRPSEDDETKIAEYRVASATRKGGRGFSGDLILLDELREHQSWDSWSAATKTTLARPKSQVWAFSNAGDTTSIVLRFMRASAHRALGWPDGEDDADILDLADFDEDFAEWEEELGELAADSLGLFEWSAAPGSKRTDLQAWAQANPSMGYTDLVPNCITVRAIAAAMKSDPPHVFDVEVLCRWIYTETNGPWPRGAWAATLDNAARPEPGRRMVCLDVSWERDRTYIARAGANGDGVPVADIAADRPGTAWAVPWLVEHRDKIAGVVVQSNGAPASSLIDDIRSARLPDGSPANLAVVEWGGADLGNAFGQLYDRLEASVGEDDPAPQVLHLAHPGLDAAALSAVPKVLSSGAVVLDRIKSPTETSALIALMGAVWGLTKQPEQKASAYEARGMLVV